MTLPGMRPNSLGTKLVWMLTAIGIAGAIGIVALLVFVITPNFNRLEEQSVTGHVERTRAALAEYATKVESAARDYGDWNDSYAYMVAPSAAFERDSFSILAMDNLAMDGMAYVTSDRRLLISRWIDLDRQAEVPATRAAFEAAIAQMDLEGALGRRSSASFYARIDATVAAVAVARVRRSDGTGSPRGYVLMARALSSEQLSQLLQLRARLIVPPPAGWQAVTRRDGTIGIAVPVAGTGDEAVALAAFDIARELSQLGRSMLLYAAAGTLLLLLLVLLALRRMITRLVLRPLHLMEHHMQRVRESGDMAVLEIGRGGDEIGSLVTSFNAMLRQLNDLREQLEAQSYKLGRSESAVAVMHNVRNALNPISTIISQGLAEPAAADRQLVDRALAELAADSVPVARRQKLAAFVAAASEAEARARADRVDALGVGREALHVVLEIIGQQQAAAHERPPVEACDVTEIVARNAAIARYGGEQSIAFVFPSKPHLVLANRVILSQVIGNLFSNAAEAIGGSGRGGAITVTVRNVDDAVRVTIADDGEGFAPEIAPDLFQRGFSTRKHKSGGLGLHWCANSMVAMGGALKLESDGPGLGARAVLTLQPARPGESVVDLAA